MPILATIAIKANRNPSCFEPKFLILEKLPFKFSKMNIEISNKYVVVTDNSCFCVECQGKDSLPEFFDSYQDALDSFYSSCH